MMKNQSLTQSDTLVRIILLQYVILKNLLNDYLARLAAENRQAGYMFCFCFFFLMMPVRPIISKSTRPIFAKFLGLVELWL